MKDTLLHEIVARFRGGASIRQIAASLRISRHTVRRALDQVEQARGGGSPGQSVRPTPRRASQLDTYQGAIADLLTRYPDITARRVYEELRRLGYEGSYTILSERVRGLRPRPAAAPVRRFETAPGEQAQMDYATYDLDFTIEGRRRVYAFSYVLGYSRRQYLHFVEFQDFATTVRQHIRAFEHLGGVAATCLYDNMKVVVSGRDGDEPVYNPRFLSFAAHYGFRPWACRPRRPQTKGKVERPFAYVESSLLGGRSFHSLAHLNEVAVWWLAAVADVRIHAQTKARPVDRHAEERPHLIPLPAQPFEPSEVVYRTVDAQGYVVYRQNFYSAPWRLIGQSVAVRTTEKELVIHDGAFIEVARHPLMPRTTTGERSRCKDHEPPRDSQRRFEQLAEQFAALGAIGPQFLEGLLASSRYGKNQAERVLALMAVYPRSDVLVALERAVRYGAFSFDAIRRILAARSRPKTPLDALADDHRSYLDNLLERDPMPPRPTSDYQILLREEAHDAETTESESKPHADADSEPDRSGDERDGAGPA
jgi:transposase